MYIVVDENKVIRYLQRINNDDCFLSDYQEIFPIIDNILENKPILGQFSKEEVIIIEQKLENFINYVKGKDKTNSLQDTFSINFRITPFNSITKPSPGYSFYLQIV